MFKNISANMTHHFKEEDKEFIDQKIEDLKRRIDQAAKFIPLDQIAISPQCGFASSVGGNPLTQDDQRRKLALVVEVAMDVWN